ncbi:MAG: hypothetical protein Q7T73_13815, partial [Beijerinckiaceae bacterium]|nr:hypothetical protein [Beijerinckiaceae bacterium]
MTDADLTPPRRRISPRQRRYRFALGFAAVVGGIVGGWMVADQPGGRGGMEMAFSGTVSTGFAIGASLFWVIGL